MSGKTGSFDVTAGRLANHVRPGKTLERKLMMMFLFVNYCERETTLEEAEKGAFFLR